MALELTCKWRNVCYWHRADGPLGQRHIAQGALQMHFAEPQTPDVRSGLLRRLTYSAAALGLV